ncbi:hypothetical protein FHX08_006377 [Rhizobium sp. BK529]|nr:hypothetical protein [Rhizobium sp. BK529]
MYQWAAGAADIMPSRNRQTGRQRQAHVFKVEQLVDPPARAKQESCG